MNSLPTHQEKAKITKPAASMLPILQINTQTQKYLTCNKDNWTENYRPSPEPDQYLHASTKSKAASTKKNGDHWLKAKLQFLLSHGLEITWFSNLFGHTLYWSTKVSSRLGNMQKSGWIRKYTLPIKFQFWSRKEK